MTVNCDQCRHFVAEPHEGYWGYCTFIPPATLAEALGIDRPEDAAAASVDITDTCSLAAWRDVEAAKQEG